MKQVALIFPGQGAQKVGMGREFYEASPEARAVFDKADELLKYLLSKMMFEGPEDELMATANCQPAIFTMSMACLAALKADARFQSVSVAYAAGLSLVEYSALCAAGVFSFEQTLRLIQKRGALMEDCARKNPGTMAAVIGFDGNALVAICKEAGAEVANFNAPDQIVITGTVDAVKKASEMIGQAGGKKVIPLSVSGGFHSTLMAPAGRSFAEEIKNIVPAITGAKVVSNVTGRAQLTPEEIRKHMSEQIYSSVLWVDSVRFIASQGITDFIEIGPGRILKGLIRKIDPSLNVYNVQAPMDIGALPF